MSNALITERRAAFHQQLVDREVLSISRDHVASNADKDQRSSRAIALSITQKLNAHTEVAKLAGQQSGAAFEHIVADFLRSTPSNSPRAHLV